MCNLKYVFPKFTVKHKSSNTNRYNLQEIKTDQHHSFMDIGQIGELLPANHHSNNVLLSTAIVYESHKISFCYETAF